MLDSMHPRLIVGVDLSPIALELAAKDAPSATLVCADITEKMPLDDGSFDVATIFNVLYHQWVKSEPTVLSNVARVLRPGGLLLFTEPAFEYLRRDLDHTVMTRRRYRLEDFDPWLESAGFEPLFGSYFTSFGAIVATISKLKRGSSPDLRPLPTPVNEALLMAARAEAWAIRHGVHVPFGTTLIRIARRKP